MKQIRYLFVKSVYIWALILEICVFGCSEEQLDDIAVITQENSSRAIPTPYMDWENLDWMPTPSNQSRISSPWSGQGSIVPTYGIDIANDRKASDGWTLLYNTFDSTAPAPLVNPYFVLYNKYRGIMRVYLYLTTSFVTPSSYLQDGLSVNSMYDTSILSFLGNDVVDFSNKPKQYMQMQPVPLDASFPLASYRWYIMQYELAYDPNIPNIPYNQIQLSWTMNYYNVTGVALGGDLVGKLNGVIGNSSDPNFFSSFTNTVGKVAGVGVLAGVGKEMLTNNTINAETGENKLGLPKGVFKDLVKGVSAALSSAAGGLPGAAMSLLSAVIGGGSTSTPISFDLKADITLEGTMTNSGAFPSSPTSLYMPGTNIASSASGYIPLYNECLGVVGFVSNPQLLTNDRYTEYTETDPFDNRTYTYSYHCLTFPEIDFLSYLNINPSVLKYADVNVTRQDLIVRLLDGSLLINPECITWEEGGYAYGVAAPGDPTHDMGVRFIIQVKPKDGSPIVTLVKTLLLKENRKCNRA